MIKTNLTTHANMGREAFPWPGSLKGRSAEDQAAIQADPGAFFGDPVMKQRLDRLDDVLDESGMIIGQNPVYIDVPHDPCPEGARGFGWWPEVDQSPALGIGETYGAETLTVDIPNKRWLVTLAVNPAPAGTVDAHFDGLEKVLHREIDATAENRRLDFITPGAGQSATYDAKAREAELIVAGATPAEADHPFVWREAAALGKTPSGRASEIIATRAVWNEIGSAIEAARQGAKVAVTEAKGNEAAMRAAAAVDWSTIGGA